MPDLTTEALLDFLSANALTWGIEVNPERGVYQSREEYLLDMDIDGDIAPLLAAENLYVAHAYPSTPVSYVAAYEATTRAALAALVDALTPANPQRDTAREGAGE